MSTYILVAVYALVFAGFILYLSDMRTDSLTRTAECVRSTAMREGYVGDLNSADAWQTFAGSCNKR